MGEFEPRQPAPQEQQPQQPQQNRDERLFLKRLGLKINQELYRQQRPVEWLAENVGVARSTIREIIAGRSNPRLLTMRSIACGLGYDNLYELLRAVETNQNHAA